MTFRTISLFTVLFPQFAAPALGADPIYGTATAHNGSLTSYPPGTGDVQVDFVFPSEALGPYRAFYYEVATHQIDFTYAPGPADAMLSPSFFYNRSGIDWTGIVIRLDGADFAGHTYYANTHQARADNPVVDIGFVADPGILTPEEIELTHPLPLGQQPFSLASSGISRFNDTGNGFTDAELTVLFDDPVQDGWQFILGYSVIHAPGLPDATSFTMYVTPIPEPGTFSTVLLAGLLICRRRQSRVCRIR